MKNIIELNNISKKFENEAVIENFSLKITEGEMIAITGKSGSGKSTLMNILGLISAPSSGEYKIYNQQIHGINSKSAMLLRRNLIGYLFQNYGLVEDETVEWNLRLMYAYSKLKRKQQDENIERMLQEFRLLNKRNKKVYQLSGGEQQRIALIRLMIKDSDIILADEPTGSLDPINRDFVMSKLVELNKKKKTVIVVTHDPLVAEMCGRNLVLQ